MSNTVYFLLHFGIKSVVTRTCSSCKKVAAFNTYGNYHRNRAERKQLTLLSHATNCPLRQKNGAKAFLNHLACLRAIDTAKRTGDNLFKLLRQTRNTLKSPRGGANRTANGYEKLKRAGNRILRYGATD